MNSILIKGGTVVNADREFKADVLIKDGKIAQVAESIPPFDGQRVINADGKYVMPGGIDTYVAARTQSIARVWRAALHVFLVLRTRLLRESARFVALQATHCSHMLLLL